MRRIHTIKWTFKSLFSKLESFSN